MYESPDGTFFDARKDGLSMRYDEYKDILNDALAKYVNDGGSVYHIGSATKEYFFDY